MTCCSPLVPARDLPVKFSSQRRRLGVLVIPPQMSRASPNHCDIEEFDSLPATVWQLTSGSHR